MPTSLPSHRPLEDVSTQELQMRWALFKSMQHGLVDKIGAPVIRRIAHQSGKSGEPWQHMMRFIMERTAIKVFFGGVGEEQNMETARRLLKKGIGTIIDNAASETKNGLSDEDRFQRALDGYGKALDICGKLRDEHEDEPDKQNRIAAAFKFSTVANYETLEAISGKLESRENHGKPVGQRTPGSLQPEFDAIYERAREFFRRAADKGIEAYVDAEETGINPAIVEMCARMLREGLKPGITIQAYLKDAETQLDQLLATDLPLNIKLVRGAYIGGQRQPREDIWDTKAQTDTCYNALLEKLYRHRNVESITVATHNQESRSIAERLANNDRSGPRLIFATLLGMGANLTAPDPALGIEERKYQPAILDESTVGVLGAIEYFARRGKEFMTATDPALGAKTRAQLELAEITKELERRGLGEKAMAPVRLLAQSVMEAMNGRADQLRAGT